MSKKQAYAPALEVSEFRKVRKTRELPLDGENLVKVGDRVLANDIVLTAELPGDMSIIRVAERMGFEASDVIEGMKVKVGDELKKDDLICTLKTFFGLFTTELKCPQDGEVEFFTELNSHLGIRHAPIPLKVNAYIDGSVVSIEKGKSVTIESDATFIQGIFGVGGERQGEIYVLPIDANKEVSSDFLKSIKDNLESKILVGGQTYSNKALKTAAELNVNGIVCGSIDAETLFEYVGHEIGVSITGDEDVPFTLIITEGFGDLAISKRVLDLAKDCNGFNCSINGATQVRAGATRPEIIIPRKDSADNSSELEQKFLEVGANIRIIRVPNFGAFGEITELPSKPEKIPTGAKVRVLRAKLENGEVVTVPRANVELV